MKVVQITQTNQKNTDFGNVFVNNSFDFSSAQNPSYRTSVYETKERFSVRITGGKKATLLAYGGNDIKLKDVSRCQFFSGHSVSIWGWWGGPEMKRCNKVLRKSV